MQRRMQRLLKTLLAVLAFLALVCLPPAGAAVSEKRLALVVGNASYKAKTLATPANDAALIAQTLRAAGFDVMGARDLDKDLLRQTFRDFTDKVANAGADTVAAVYFAGYGLQFEGENYLVPTDADITQASDVPVRAVRLSEPTHALAALHLKAIFIVLDAARASPFVLSGQPPASGFAWVEPETNMLIAFNAAPGSVSPVGGDGYGPYAKALAEMIREGGLTPANVFDRVRLRVNELTKGAQVPWDASKIETPFKFFERTPGAPLRADSPERAASMRSQSMRSLGAHDAYMVALMRDTFDAYADFLADYWRDPMTRRVRALLAARREAITWRRAYQANVPDAYWSYLERYPRGPHLGDARRLLTHLGAATEPPAKFARMDYDVPPPLPDELEYVERAVLVFDDPALAFESPQPSPVYFLAPSPPEFVDLTPPAASSGAHTLPAPTFAPLPAYVRLPADVLAPNPSIAGNARETLAIRTAIDVPTRPDEQAVSSTISSTSTTGNTNNPAESPHLPPWVGPKAMLINSQSALPSAMNPVASEEIKAPPSRPLPTVSLTPQWLPDPKTLSNLGIQPPTPTADSEAPIPVPTMLVSPPTGMPLQTRRNAVLSSRAIGSVPLPIPRPVTPAPPPTRPRTKPTADAASTSETSEVDQAEQPTAPLLDRLARWSHFAPTPKVEPEAVPPKPQKKPCPVVNGIRICS